MKRHYFWLIASSGFLSMMFLFQNCGDFDAQGNPIAAENEETLFQAAANDNENEVAIGLYRRLAGVTLPIDDPTILTMESRIVEGDIRGAAEIAVESPNFINITVRDFATKMSSREEEVTGELNDMVATVMGSVRDDISAQTMLSGNFFYKGQSGLDDVRDNMLDDLLSSNNHYRDLSRNVADISSVLERVDGQKVIAPNGSVVDLGDPGGLLTTRGWMKEHAIAGTNRRPIEFAFQIFMCREIQEWAKASRGDGFIGRDVERIAGDDNDRSIFDTTCKSCHSGMDALRPAMAYFDYEETDAASGEGFVKYRYTYATDPNPNDENNPFTVPGPERMVASKYRRDSDVYPEGKVVTDNQWVNLADDDPSLGFTLSNTGYGMSSFSRLMATSQQFSRCMVRRAYKAVCRQDSLAGDIFVEELAAVFEQDNYNMKKLFVNVAINPSCMGLGR